LSTRIVRGDRIGLIGPNGVGKTTLLRLLVGEIPPDQGEIRRGTNVQVAYFDQQREQLDPERTVVDTVADGNDTVTIRGITRHVHGYLEDFLFSPERARSPVKSLSGGERNRLLLARLLTRQANVLVLDEPTNDLDIETLELLETELVDFPGTLLIVSHDRRFLNNVVTSTLVFEGEGRVAEYVGGYDDWLQQRSSSAQVQAASAPAARPRSKSSPALPPSTNRKLSYRERLELEELPARIAALEAEHVHLQALVAGPEFYKEPPAAIASTLERLRVVSDELDGVYRRWDELDSRST
jgi:ATP-binding cassette subfamily F protein uup